MPKGVSSRVFPNHRRMHKYRNLPFRKQLSFFVSLFPFFGIPPPPPPHKPLGFFSWGEIPQNTHRNKKASCLRICEWGVLYTEGEKLKIERAGGVKTIFTYPIRLTLFRKTIMKINFFLKYEGKMSIRSTELGGWPIA